MEKMAYNDIKSGFQARFNAEVAAKADSIEKSNYDPRTEVNELKKQFSELIDTLKGEKENVIRKQQKAVDNLNVPSSDEIAKMDWNEVHLAMARLERNFR
jgi:HAMP domain-containing protein